MQETVKARIDRRLAAILAADVFGYSRLMGADEEGTLAQLKAHRRHLIDPKIKQHHGRIVKTTGDGMLVEFASPIEAVRCALEVQRGMITRNLNIPPDKRIIFRVGINLGDVIAEKSDLFGEGVNIAARLEALSEPGGIAISRTVHDQIRDRLPIAFGDAGEHEVKNIARPVSVYALSADGVGKLNAETPARTPESRPRWQHAIAVVATVATLGLVWFGYTRLTAPSPASANTIKGPAVAVLPFDNLTGDPAQASFADGLSEELISDLSRFTDLQVLARNTTFTFKGKAVDVLEVGRKLNANYFIEGSVRRAGNQIRVTAQLISAADGNHVWSENYERDASAIDFLSIQDEIAGRISGSVATWYGAIARNELERSRGKPLADLTAYECMVGAAAAARLQVVSEPMRRGRACLESLVQHEPDNADGWSMLALVRYVQRSFGAGLDPPDSEDPDKRAYLVGLTMQAASRAVQLAPQSSFARSALVRAYFVSCQGDQLRVEAEKAIALNPKDSGAMGAFGGYIAFIGQWETGVALVKKAIAISGAETPNFFY
ncbi:MAG: guanylyl cyclase, partial [Bradyrhizobium sp.]|uniref:adenylate/guanylate cyclase domain-containing protein n=1 Tax=Bradyrhizobium sp. TaxID=376 RepID=UPI001D507423